MKLGNPSRKIFSRKAKHKISNDLQVPKNQNMGKYYVF